MLNFFKSMFADEPDRYVIFQLSGPSAIGKVHFQNQGEDMDAIFGDLPRLTNPQGIDDTDKICADIVKAYPCYDDFPDQTHNRRSLYMAIHTLRQSAGGWVADYKVPKEPAKARVLSQALH